MNIQLRLFHELTKGYCSVRFFKIVTEIRFKTESKLFTMNFYSFTFLFQTLLRSTVEASWYYGLIPKILP